jgi:hypothetical protein
VLVHLTHLGRNPLLEIARLLGLLDLH